MKQNQTAKWKGLNENWQPEQDKETHFVGGKRL